MIRKIIKYIKFIFEIDNIKIKIQINLLLYLL
jgi:hypothetical protein